MQGGVFDLFTHEQVKSLVKWGRAWPVSVCMLGWLVLGLFCLLIEVYTVTEGQYKERKSGLFAGYF